MAPNRPQEPRGRHGLRQRLGALGSGLEAVTAPADASSPVEAEEETERWRTKCGERGPRWCGRVCLRAPHGTTGVFTATWACFPVVTF